MESEVPDYQTPPDKKSEKQDQQSLLILDKYNFKTEVTQVHNLHFEALI